MFALLGNLGWFSRFKHLFTVFRHFWSSFWLFFENLLGHWCNIFHQFFMVLQILSRFWPLNFYYGWLFWSRMINCGKFLSKWIARLVSIWYSWHSWFCVGQNCRIYNRFTVNFRWYRSYVWVKLLQFARQWHILSLIFSTIYRWLGR